MRVSLPVLFESGYLLHPSKLCAHGKTWTDCCVGLCRAALQFNYPYRVDTFQLDPLGDNPEITYYASNLDTAIRYAKSHEAKSGVSGHVDVRRGRWLEFNRWY